MTIATEFDSNWKLDESTGCWNWLRSKDRKGYGKLSVDGRLIQAHRFSWSRAHASVPTDMLVLHRCDNPGCVNPKHLFLGNSSDNMRDMTHKGRSALAKLNATDAERIRDLWRYGISRNSIAAYFQIDKSHVARVIRGEVWEVA